MWSSGKTLWLCNANTAADTLRGSHAVGSAAPQRLISRDADSSGGSVSAPLSCKRARSGQAGGTLAQRGVLRSCNLLSVTSPSVWGRARVAPMAAPGADRAPATPPAPAHSMPFSDSSHVLPLSSPSQTSFSNNFPKTQTHREQPPVKDSSVQGQ